MDDPAQLPVSTGVTAACDEVMRLAQHVRIDDDALKATCDAFPREGLPVPEWNATLHFFEGTRSSANYVLVLDALNFSFWPDPGEPPWKVAYAGQEWQGYWALAAALKRAVEEGTPLLEAGWLAEATPGQVEHLLRGSAGRIPLMEARHEHLQEVGRVLSSRYDGHFAHMIEDVRRDAVALTLRIARDLRSFDDVAAYEPAPGSVAVRVPLYKRAQITAVDLFGTFNGRDCGDLLRLDALTAFADYKVPQVLRRLGILRYGPDLAASVDAEEQIAPGDPREVEIRAATVAAVEGMRRQLRARGLEARAFEIDWVLWGMGQSSHADDRPYHKTRTTYY